ncbi:ABC transporter ATP-binding protein [Kribbella sp. NPDC056345]|uniref:ABC transporter ATP-binding protein n=1 Tax=Kribbella sp. NPDC056345 TaxID=3345789 RepID=UPI0035D9B8F2
MDSVSFTMEQGESVALLGPNGAGKTTTMRMICSVSPPTSGTLHVLGMDVRKDGIAIRQRIGVCPQNTSLDLELSAEENLFVYARYFGLRRQEARARAASELARMGLADRARDKVTDLSGGMQRRLVIARALINRPALLMLDEPTTGLDPQARSDLWESLREIRQSGISLLLTTHYMEEVEVLAERVIFMHSGRVVADGPSAALVREHTHKYIVEIPYIEEDIPSALAVLDDTRVERLPTRWLVYTERPEEVRARLRQYLVPDLDDSVIAVRESTLEDVFLTISGRGLRDGAG